MKDKQSLHVKLDAETHKQFKLLAITRNTNMTEVIKQVLIDYLKTGNK